MHRTLQKGRERLLILTAGGTAFIALVLSILSAVATAQAQLTRPGVEAKPTPGGEAMPAAGDKPQITVTGGGESTAIDRPGNAGISAPTTKPATRPATGPSLNRPLPQPIPPNPIVLTDEKIGNCIKKGIEYLYKQFDPKTHMVSAAAAGAEAKDASYLGGLDALCVYSLMQCSLATGDDDDRISPRKKNMRDMVAALEAANLDAGSRQTYAHGLRSTALALYISTLHLPEGKDEKPNADSEEYEKAVKAIQNDVVYGLLACDAGAYSYTRPVVKANDTQNPFYDHRDLTALFDYYHKMNPNNLPKPKGGWDNSNSQYGLLGVWSAVDAEIGVEIPIQYWAMVNHHWELTQLGDGGWGYAPDNGPGNGQTTLTMTCAGLASEFVTHEYLEPVNISDKPGRLPFSSSEKRGLDWFEKGNNAIKEAIGNGYALYGVERVGLASGFKFFGQHDWYRELATAIVAGQDKDGSFTGQWGQLPNSAYSLLFLSRGRHPILMNKLRFDSDGKKGPGFWCNRPQDAANLARYVGHRLENALNWQVINVDTDATQWLDSPILEIASQKDVSFSKEQLDKLRGYVESGGMLFVQADGDAPEFNKSVPALAHALFPKYELQAVPPDSPIYGIENGVYKVPPRRDLKMIYNGSRILLLWSPRDIAKYWQQRDVVRHKLEFQFGANLFVYAAGKRNLRNRLESPYVPPVAKTPIATIKVARLEYAGNFDPEPGAWRRYVNLFQQQTGTRLELENIQLSALKPGDAPIADLTGTARYGFSEADTAAIAAYVQRGGVLVIDQCGGTGQFDQSVNAMLARAFPGVVPQPLSPVHPMLDGGKPGTVNLSQYKNRYRTATTFRGLSHGTGMQIIAAGKGHVIFTPLDLTSGLLSTATGGILGFDSNYSEAVMKNIIFWTVDGQPDK